MNQNFLNALSKETQNLLFNLYDALIEKVILKVYNNLEEEEKGNFVKILKNGSEEEKEKFLKKYLKDFKNSLIEEIQQISKEIKNSIQGV